MVSSEHIAELERLRDHFSESIKIKGGAKSEKTAEVRKLAKLFKSCDDSPLSTLSVTLPLCSLMPLFSLSIRCGSEGSLQNYWITLY